MLSDDIENVATDQAVDLRIKIRFMLAWRAQNAALSDVTY
jgi:hypothetical protein